MKDISNIFVIDKATKENLRKLDFIPRREERIIIDYNGRNLEYKVKCIVYYPYNIDNIGVFVFVDLVDNYYEKMIQNIKWQ